MRYKETFHTKRVGHPRYPVLASAALTAYATAFPGELPKEVVDVGCSIGALLAAIQHKTPCKAYGLDYSLKNLDTIFDGEYFRFDLNKDNAASIWAQGDLVICQEVLEHIEPENTGNALKALTDLSKPQHSLLVFGAAKPGQPGKHHVNCRTRDEWKSLLEKEGWVYHPFATTTYSEVLNGSKHISPTGCYMTNTMCLYRP